MKLYVIGFMGSGKTYLGKLLALKLNETFFDLDREIERIQHQTIKTIFMKEGESFFRTLESELLLNLEKQGIIATGGGIVEREINRTYLMGEDKITVWLNTEWSRILEHLKKSDDRPLYNYSTDKEIYALWKRRIKLYKECADIVINNPDIETLINSINIFKKLNTK